MMRVLIDATAIPADRGGVGRYVDDLVPALSRCDVELAVVCQERDAAALAASAPSAEIVPVVVRGRVGRLVWEQAGLPRLLGAIGSDVLHSPHYTMPRLAGVPVVVTLHDATFFSHPELHSAVKARFFRSAIRAAVRRAAAVVVPSAATADEVVRYAGADRLAFHVAHHGVDQTVFHPVDRIRKEEVARALGLVGQPYVAFLGTLEPRKNVPALVHGWVRAVTGRPTPPALVLAGGPGWDKGVEPALAAIPAELTVLRPGYLPLEDLAGFLGGAEVVAYPSLGEGFGLPVLEAMACGAAVLTTEELSLPEVGGTAVAYCGTTAQEIGAGLTRLLDDASLRQRLAAAAVARADQFTWDASAQVHMEAYHAATRSR